MYKYKEAVERQVDSMYKNKPGLKRSRKISKLSSLLSMIALIFILVLLTRVYVGGFTDRFEGSYIVLTFIILAIIGISEFYVRNYILKK